MRSRPCTSSSEGTVSDDCERMRTSVPPSMTIDIFPRVIDARKGVRHRSRSERFKGLESARRSHSRFSGL